MNTPAEIVKQALIDSNIGIAVTTGSITNWQIYAHHLPDGPDAVIFIKDTSGDLGGVSQPTGKLWIKHGIQVLVRGEAKNRQAARTKIDEIATFFDMTVRYTNVTVESDNYVLETVNRTGDVLSLGREEVSRRPIFSINAVIDFNTA